MSGNILAIRIDRGELTPLTEIRPNSLEWLQRQVGGYVEVVLSDGRNPGIVVLGNEDGRSLWKPQATRFDGQTLHGPLLVLGQTGANFRALEGEEVMRVQLVRRLPVAGIPQLPLLTISERGGPSRE